MRLLVIISLLAFASASISVAQQPPSTIFDSPTEVLVEVESNNSHENIFDAYSTAHLWRGLVASLDAQFIVVPGYNLDRGPVFVLGLRVHLEP